MSEILKLAAKIIARDKMREAEEDYKKKELEYALEICPFKIGDYKPFGTLKAAKAFLAKHKQEETKMKNDKRINILAEGKWVLPVGTNVRKYDAEGLPNVFKCSRRLNVNTERYTYEVDFTELPPLYPSPDMDVPEGGIFTKTRARLLEDIGKVGFTLYGYKDRSHFLYKWDWFNIEKSKNIKAFIELFELERTLPKTINVCACCFKEVCACKAEKGWYGLIDGKGVCYWNGKTATCMLETSECRFVGEHMIDWDNPINVTPVKEVE